MIGSEGMVDTGRRRLWAALACLVIFLMSATAYFDVYYKAGDAARAAMVSDDSVRVSREKDFIAFDGPGDTSALVFYPGAKVEPTAYAPLLKAVAALGVDGFLIEPPLRIALMDAEAAGRVMAARDYPRWFLAGHSLGGVAAAACAAKHPDQVEGLILLSSYPTSALPENLRLLSIYGSNDEVLNRSNYEKQRALWPDNSLERVIDGANHAGFGDYGPQRGDGAAEITAEQQRTATAEYIAAFCIDAA